MMDYEHAEAEADRIVNSDLFTMPFRWLNLALLALKVFIDIAHNLDAMRIEYQIEASERRRHG